MKDESAVRKLGGGTVVAVDAVGERHRDRAVGEPDLRDLAAVDLLEEFGEGELGRRRLAAARVDPRGDQAADEQRGRNDVARAPEKR